MTLDRFAASVSLPSTSLSRGMSHFGAKQTHAATTHVFKLSLLLIVISPEPLIISDICKLFCSPNYRPRTDEVTEEGARRRRGAHFLCHNWAFITRGGGRGGRGRRRSSVAPLSHLARCSLGPSADRQSANWRSEQIKRPLPWRREGAPLCAPDAAFQTSNSLGVTEAAQ